MYHLLDHNRTLHSAHKCIRAFHMVVTRNSRCFLNRINRLILSSGDVMCFLRGKNWILLYYLKEIRCLNG